jgi:hypothetical protein
MIHPLNQGIWAQILRHLGKSGYVSKHHGHKTILAGSLLFGGPIFPGQVFRDQSLKLRVHFLQLGRLEFIGKSTLAAEFFIWLVCKAALWTYPAKSGAAISTELTFLSIFFAAFRTLHGNSHPSACLVYRVLFLIPCLTL